MRSASAVLLELACNCLERGSIRWDAVPAQVDEMNKVTADEIGGPKLGPHIFIQYQMTDGTIVRERPRKVSLVKDLPTANPKRVDVHLWPCYLSAFH